MRTSSSFAIPHWPNFNRKLPSPSECEKKQQNRRIYRKINCWRSFPQTDQRIYKLSGKCLPLVDVSNAFTFIFFWNNIRKCAYAVFHMKWNNRVFFMSICWKNVSLFRMKLLIVLNSFPFQSFFCCNSRWYSLFSVQTNCICHTLGAIRCSVRLLNWNENKYRKCQFYAYIPSAFSSTMTSKIHIHFNSILDLILILWKQ